MAAEPRTLCDIFLAAAGCGKPSLLMSKVGGVWKSISAADFGFTVKALSLGLNGLGIQPGDRVAILSENRPEWAMADYAILCAGAWSVPIYPTLPAAQIAPLLNDCSAKAIFVSTLEQLGKILPDQGAVRQPRPRDPHRRQPSGRARLHDLSRRGGPRPADARDEPGGLRAARGAREARGRRDDHLHLRHHGRAQGSDAHARQLRVERRHRLRGDPVRVRCGRPVVSARCRTSSSG